MSSFQDISDRIAKQKLALEDERAGLDASDQLSEEIARLKAGVATERVRFSHITEALEATKGSLEEVMHTTRVITALGSSLNVGGHSYGRPGTVVVS